ncbi:MAG TPA: hypothetical protein VJ203_16200 [Bacteroidales bacterium]|nr:hypothetical protein [Bacteroidales bacterium]
MSSTACKSRRHRNPHFANEDSLDNLPFFSKSLSGGLQKKNEKPFFSFTTAAFSKHSGGGNVIQAAPAKGDCAEYESGEVKKSHTQKGILNTDTFIPGAMSLINRQGDLVISDFGVDWGSVKDSTKNEPVLQQWIEAFETNPDYWLEIEGYTDCTGKELHNAGLRQRRASKVYQLFNKARSRVLHYKAAPENEYMTGNGDMDGRAINRGVAIRFVRNYTFPGENIEGEKPKPPKPKPPKPLERPDTSDCDQNQKDALARAFTKAKEMVRAAIGEIHNDTLLKKYFGKDAPAHRYHIKQNLVSISDGLKSVPTFECEKADSWWCDGAVARVIPIIGLNIHICPSAIANGDDYLARTIVHEAAHGYAFLFIPDDLCAGGWPSSRDTTDAEDNADCYGEFAGDALTI